MIKNNIEIDVKVKCIEAGKTQAQVAKSVGTTSQYVNRIVKKQNGLINKSSKSKFIQNRKHKLESPKAEALLV